MKSKTPCNLSTCLNYQTTYRATGRGFFNRMTYSRNMKILTSPFLVLMGLVCALATAQEPDTAYKTLWQDSKDPILEVMALEATRGDLPASKWVGRDQRDLDRDINKLLDDVLEVMQISGLTDARKRYRNLERRIEKRRVEMRELREATLSADEEKSPLEFYKKTKAEYEAQITALQKDVDALHVQQDTEVGKMMAAYKEMGLQLPEEQVRFYLTSVSGADMMNLSAIFNNVKILNQQLETLVAQSPEDPETARRYYGVHVTLIHSMVYAHQHVLDHIDYLYLPQIDELEKENDILIKETRDLIRFADPTHLDLLNSMARTQQVTHDALELYRNHLQAVRAQVYEGQKALNQRFQVAMNAYRTIRIAASLAAEMQSAVKDLSALREMHLPALIPLNSDALQQKFSEITRELEGE